MLAKQKPEDFIDGAVDALSTGVEAGSIFDELPVPVYTTDETGAVTYWNGACTEFAGRQPELGQDRWCVTWKLYTTAGDSMPHDKCPMAQAIKQQRPVREVIAIAERPDGSRVAFKPYPTPFFDRYGKLRGAVNMLIDVTDEQTSVLHRQADHCRRLAQAMYDRVTSKILGDMADGFDRTADELEQARPL